MRGRRRAVTLSGRWCGVRHPGTGTERGLAEGSRCGSFLSLGRVSSDLSGVSQRVTAGSLASAGVGGARLSWCGCRFSHGLLGGSRLASRSRPRFAGLTRCAGRTVIGDSGLARAVGCVVEYREFGVVVRSRSASSVLGYYATRGARRSVRDAGRGGSARRRHPFVLRFFLQRVSRESGYRRVPA